MTLMRLLVAAWAALGCGTDTRWLEGADAAAEEASSGTGGALGGQPSGTGGAGSSGGGVQSITEADVLLCELWPICPEGVIAPGGYERVMRSERCGLGGYACSVCRDTRGGACSDFVGRCRAPIVVSNVRIFDAPSSADCTDGVMPDPASPRSYYRCTGPALVGVVCGDDPWP
jgi:hypothetical protein